MSRLALCALLVGIGFAPLAMGEPVNDSTQRDLDQQRRRIETERKEKMKELAAQDAACLSRFAVTDCQNKVGLRRLELLADLRRQEARLNEADRQQKGAEQLQRIEDKAEEKRKKLSERQATPAADTMQDRQKTLDEKVLNHKKQGTNATAATPPREKAPVLSGQTIESNRRAYAEKQRAAQLRRAEREKKLLDKGGVPLPLPQTP
jgi:hypothetical protein